jgi:hypothetical protein
MSEQCEKGEKIQIQSNDRQSPRQKKRERRLRNNQLRTDGGVKRRESGRKIEEKVVGG